MATVMPHKLNTSDIKSKIARELTSHPVQWYGAPLESCLVEPTRCPYEDGSNEGETIELWLVFEERPETKDGYKIVYDDDMDQFGLATPGKTKDVFLGYCGTFVSTLEGM